MLTDAQMMLKMLSGLIREGGYPTAIDLFMLILG
jgi:hypothetical protein